MVGRDTGQGFGNLADVRCHAFNEPHVFDVRAGETWYVRAALFVFSGGGSVTIDLETVEPPPNDDFANAKPITQLPFSETVDGAASGNEPGERTPSCSGQSAGSVWYSYTPSSDGWITAAGPFAGQSEVVAAYTGSSLQDLVEVGCRTFGSQFTLRVSSGTTYYFQVGGLFGGGGPLHLDLTVAPNPVAGFGYSPGDPSTFDDLQVFSGSFDPGGNQIVSQVWDYGDGTAPTSSTSHRYGRDGDYTITLTVTTSDGRTGSTAQVVSVRTHDVAIKSFDVPTSGTPGRTKQVTVGIANTRVPEVADVVLYKSVPGGDFEQVGSQRVSLPVRTKNAQTKVTFTVSFTQADLAVGKVTFKASVVLVGGRDCHPADNTVIAWPTLVR
ncbi:MAG TPA: PKD domain-containing protein [Gaiellaceae bacterium]|nr:PKD domain-containing protein [Gaiellaceae bacterium]